MTHRSVGDGHGARRTASPRHRLRPLRAAVPVTSSVLVIVGWGLVAQNSGAGWVQALGDVLTAALLIGLIGPAIACGRARIALVDCPQDATAGMPTEIVVSSSTRLRARPVDPPGPETLIGPTASRVAPQPSAPRRDGARTQAHANPVTLLPVRRGVHGVVVLEVTSAAPFGLLWWRRTVMLPLPGELLVGPRLGEPLALPAHTDDRHGDSVQRLRADNGEPRGVRPYRPGDRRRSVHWAATAHTGEVMVREREGPAAQPVTVTLHLPTDEDAADGLAARALGTIVRLLDRGTVVQLVTDEEAGVRSGPVSDRRGASRRLARAVPATPTPGSTPSEVGGVLVDALSSPPLQAPR